jgi:hypothetical protein
LASLGLNLGCNSAPTTAVTLPGAPAAAATLSRADDLRRRSASAVPAVAKEKEDDCRTSDCCTATEANGPRAASEAQPRASAGSIVCCRLARKFLTTAE